MFKKQKQSRAVCCNFPLQMSSWYLWVSILAQCFDQCWEHLQGCASGLAKARSFRPLCVRQKNALCWQWCSFPNEAEGNMLLPNPLFVFVYKTDFNSAKHVFGWPDSTILNSEQTLQALLKGPLISLTFSHASSHIGLLALKAEFLIDNINISASRLHPWLFACLVMLHKLHLSAKD